MDVPAEEASAPSKPTPSRSAKTLPSLDRSHSGRVMVKMDVPMDGHAKLVLSNVPEDPEGRVHVKLLRVENAPEINDCELGIMLDGQKLKPSRTKKARANVISMLTVELPHSALADMAVAQKVTLKACNFRWLLGTEQIGLIRTFVEVCEQEKVWAADDGAIAAAGYPAPSSGWPTWKVTNQSPAEYETGPELDGASLYSLLSPSVLQVEAVSGDGSSFGSAVAVAPAELLTNCHVVAGSRKILVSQLKDQWVAELERSDPASDRCVLRANGAQFTPVRGVRAYGDLKVGEAVYTLGAPSGLERTISDGVLSGLREENGIKSVQTTAPISPGSSGGGLFDRRGNLIGITRGSLVGKKNVNQSLNFAVPADAFWQVK